MACLLGDFFVALEEELEVLECHVPILQLVKQHNKFEQQNSQDQPRQTGTTSALFAGKKEEDKACILIVPRVTKQRTVRK